MVWGGGDVAVLKGPFRTKKEHGAQKGHGSNKGGGQVAERLQLWLVRAVAAVAQ
jgi:hypothetical protein